MINEWFEWVNLIDIYHLIDSSNYQELKKYYYKTWIGVQGATRYKKPIFHPSLWNVCNNKLRTNNYSEASHSVLNKYFTDTIDAIPFVEILDKTIKKDMKKLTDT